MLVLLSSSQKLLDIFGDLLGLADDVLGAGEGGVRLRPRVVQLGDGAAFTRPAAAPQPPSPAQTAGTQSVTRADKTFHFPVLPFILPHCG